MPRMLLGRAQGANAIVSMTDEPLSEQVRRRLLVGEAQPFADQLGYPIEIVMIMLSVLKWNLPLLEETLISARSLALRPEAALTLAQHVARNGDTARQTIAKIESEMIDAICVENDARQVRGLPRATCVLCGLDVAPIPPDRDGTVWNQYCGACANVIRVRNRLGEMR